MNKVVVPPGVRTCKFRFIHLPSVNATHITIRAPQDITVVLLPVSLPQLKDPINGIFREGLELAYDRALRPNHADELREMVQDPKSKIEIVFFLDAYDGGSGFGI